MTGAQRKFALLVALLVLCVILTGTFLLLGMQWAASFTGIIGPFLVVYAFFLYVCIFDSKKRWPGVPFGERVFRILTFKA